MEKMLKATTNTNRNGFEMHDIQHLSASSVNKAREALDAWVVSYIGGVRTPAGYALWIKLVEQGFLQIILCGKVKP